jgi:hypothetical protein
LIPIGAVLDDGNPPPSLSDAARAVDKSLVKIVFAQWEHPWADCALQATRAAFPDALLFWETPGDGLSGDTFEDGSTGHVPGTPWADACSPSPMPAGTDWFRHADHDYGLRGVFIETNEWDDSNAAVAKIQAQYPAWRDLQGVPFEVDAYPKFWSNYDADQQRAHSDRILAAIPWLHGFASGATTHAPIVDGPTRSDRFLGELSWSDVTPLHLADDWQSWPVTTRVSGLTLSLTGVHVDLDNGRPDAWPDSNARPAEFGALLYTVGLVMKIDGVWYASAPIQYWRGLYESGGAIQNPGQLPDNWFYRESWWGPMAGHQPAPGEIVGVFVCAGDCRDGNGAWSAVHERSNIALFSFPAPGESAKFTNGRCSDTGLAK